jgi:hypothetical protein
MRANSGSTNFVTGEHVRDNAQDLNLNLYSKEGAVTGYTGPNTGVAAAAGDFGGMTGGKKKKSKKKSSKKKKSSTKKKKSSTKKAKKKKSSTKKKKSSTKKAKKKKSSTKKKKSSTKKKKSTTTLLEDAKNLFNMRGGSGSGNPSSYHQYLSNTPISGGYSTGGILAPLDSALAPGNYTPINNCKL